jgi:hypothetical protein
MDPEIRAKMNLYKDDQQIKKLTAKELKKKSRAAIKKGGSGKQTGSTRNPVKVISVKK